MGELKWSEPSEQDQEGRQPTQISEPTSLTDPSDLGMPAIVTEEPTLGLARAPRRVSGIVKFVAAAIMGTNGISGVYQLSNALWFLSVPRGWELASGILIFVVMNLVFFWIGMSLWRARQWAVYVLFVPATCSTVIALHLSGLALIQLDFEFLLGSLFYLLPASLFWWTIASAFRHWSAFT